MAVAMVVSAVTAAPIPVSQSESWLRWVIPLPKEARIARQITLPSAGVRLVLRAGAGEIERNALRKLSNLFIEKSGTDGNKGQAFEILLGVCDAQGRINGVAVPDAARLNELPNKEQAYLIRFIGTDRLVLAALNECGVFYAALTLRQLIESKFSGEQVTLPLAEITDWPDMAERGLWVSSTGVEGGGPGIVKILSIEWMTERKMNLVEFHTLHRVSSNGTPAVAIDRAKLCRGRLYAVKMVPIISHLNGMGRLGVYDAYPDLRGKGEKAVWRERKGPQEVENAVLTTTLYAPCASNPKLHEILAGWMRGYASYEGVRDISCWLGELSLRCECAECAKSDQFTLEARAFVKAWRLAVKDYPDLRIRVLLTQGSYKFNDKVLAELPPEVGATYYDGGKTYDSSPEPMIYPLLADYAVKGGWLGCYPQLTPSWRIVSPWSCPQFIKFRMTEFVDKKVTSLAGYVVYDNRNYDFNVTAAAEWSWNAHGRDEREFALAWATRQGLAPDETADWAVMLGRVSWELYGARLVESYFFKDRIGAMVAARAKLPFGKGLFKYIADEQQLRNNLETCRQALNIAEGIGSPAMVAETKVILTYYQMLTEISGICVLLADHAQIAAAEQMQLQQHMNRLVIAGTLNSEALFDWERAVQVGSGGTRMRDGVQATDNILRSVAKALKPFGIRDSSSMLAEQKIGAWTPNDFKEQARITNTFDVTDFIQGPGRYLVTLQYTGGFNGIGISRAALIAMPKNDAGKRTELSVDQHAGSTGNKSSNNIYELKLDEYTGDCRYFVAVTISGVRPQDQKQGQGGGEGVVRMRRVRDLDWQIQVMQVAPAAAVASSTLFSGKGIRVGVFAGGYGSGSIVELLKKTDGFDAATISMGHFREHGCDVVVLPNLRWDSIPETFVKDIEEFISTGGGVITMHDAVGYRSKPNLCKSVCAGGNNHVREETWKIVAQHPVTAGLPSGKNLTQNYYDHILLVPGPDGKVLALSSKTEQPIVIAGDYGKGRYVACGLLIGVAGSDTRDTAPNQDEAILLCNAVRWCAQK